MKCKICGKEIPDGTELCAECSMNEALGSIQTVHGENNHLNKKLIIIICIAVLLTVSITTAVIVKFKKSADGNNPEPLTGESEYESTYTDTNGVTHSVTVTASPASPQNPNKPDKTTAKTSNSQPVQTAPATNPNKIGGERKEEKIEIDSDVQNTLNAFFSGKFYFEAYMYADSDQPVKMEMAISGNNLEGIMYDTDMTMGIMQLDGETYFFNPVSNKYIKFTEDIAEALGLDMSDMNFGNFSDIFGKKLTPDSQYNTTINGNDAVCYKFTNDNGFTKFYFVDNKLTEVDQYNNDGKKETQFAITAFSPSIPSNMLTLNGLSKAKSILSIMN